MRENKVNLKVGLAAIPNESNLNIYETKWIPKLYLISI